MVMEVVGGDNDSDAGSFFGFDVLQPCFLGVDVFLDRFIIICRCFLIVRSNHRNVCISRVLIVL